MIEHENSKAFGAVVSRARRFQREQLATAIAASGPRGMRVGEVAQALGWDIGMAYKWVDEAVDDGELAVVTGETSALFPRFVTAANLRAVTQADGGGE